MRVMQVMAGAAQGGAETFFVDLVSALGRAGLEQRIVIRRNEERAGVLRRAGLSVGELRFGGPLDLFTRGALGREIEAFGPDIVQTWMVRATRACPKTRPGAGGWPRFGRLRPADFVWVGWLGGYYKPAVFRPCDYSVCVTPDIARHLREAGLPDSRVRYLPTFAVSEPAEPLDRAAQATPETAPLLLALGRLHVKKAFDVLLAALVDVPGAWLWIAGEGGERAKLERLARDLGVAERVRFLGWRRDREALLATADLCVFPSRYEPFGTVTLEAWAAGRPLVAAASAGPAGVIRDGEDGLLVPVDDAPALAAAIRRVLDDPDLGRRLAEAGRRRFEAEFTEEACVARYLAFYRSILAPAESARAS